VKTSELHRVELGKGLAHLHVSHSMDGSSFMLVQLLAKTSEIDHLHLGVYLPLSSLIHKSLEMKS
jgi:hypothetical protein